jgi:hypothetical protein
VQPHEREPDGGLAGSGLAHQSERLALGQPERFFCRIIRNGKGNQGTRSYQFLHDYVDDECRA